MNTVNITFRDLEIALEQFIQAKRDWKFNETIYESRKHELMPDNKEPIISDQDLQNRKRAELAHKQFIGELQENISKSYAQFVACQKRLSDLLEPEKEYILNCHVGGSSGLIKHFVTKSEDGKINFISEFEKEENRRLVYTNL